MIYRTVTVDIDGEAAPSQCTVETRAFSCSFDLSPGAEALIEIRLFADTLNAPDTAIQQLTVTSSDPDQNNAATISTPVAVSSDTDVWASMFQLNMSSFPGAFLPLLALLLFALAARVAEHERGQASSTPTPTSDPGASS